MAYNTFIAPRHIHSGPGSLDALADLGGKKAFIVTDEVIKKLGILKQVEKILKASGAKTKVFDKVEPEPSKDTAWKVGAMMRTFKPDLIVGLGGGSAMDVGKVAWVLYEHPNMAELNFKEFERGFRKAKLRKKATYVAIATSSGTGSEVTSSAVVTDWDQKPPYKAGLSSLEVIPDVAIVDPNLTLSMPPAVTANTGFDALIHATECYILIDPNPIVDALALSAANTIFKWLPKAVKNGNDLEARDQMHTAALKAGMAFSNGRLGAVHVPAHDIGSSFNIPHGRSNAFMLCPVFAHLYKHRKKRFADLATALGFKGSSQKEKTNNLLKGLDSLKRKVDIPVAIKKSKISEKKFMKEIDGIVDAYMARLGNMLGGLPLAQQRQIALPTNAEVVKDLYMHAWNGTREVLK